MTTLQTRRHNDLVAQLGKENQRRDDLIAKLVKSDGKVQKLRRAVVRSSKRLDSLRLQGPSTPPPPAPAPAPAPEPKPAPKSGDVTEISWAEMTGANLVEADEPPIPAFLDRKANGKPDPDADIRREADRRWRNWTPGKNAKGQTKLSRPPLRSFIKEVKDERTRMPLTGRAALEAIRKAK